MREQSANADAAVARIAASQHGVISFTQLVRAGVDKSGTERRVRAGRLHRIHRGVYAVGHRGLSNEGRWMAAVLACGPGAALSHRSAAELWALLPPSQGTIHITVSTSGGRKKRPGLRIHRYSLPQSATTRRHGLAVTTPARTLADLKRVVPPHVHRQAVRQAEYFGLPLAGTPTDHTRSELERSFLRLCRRYRLPEPEVNVRIGPFTVDFLWRRQRLVVETDGWAAHRGNQAFEDDHQRELEVRARGFELRRFTSRQVREGPRAVADTVESALQGHKLSM